MTALSAEALYFVLPDGARFCEQNTEFVHRWTNVGFQIGSVEIFYVLTALQSRGSAPSSL
jgi:hypothetical protein